MRKYFSYFIVFLIVMLLKVYCFAAGSMEDDSHKGHHHEETGQSDELSGKIENGIRIIEVKASRYKFDPDPIAVRFGEKVRLILTSSDVTHGIAISEFKVNVSITPGKTETVEFIADKKGTFHAYCSVYCGPGHAHMHATFIVR